MTIKVHYASEMTVPSYDQFIEPILRFLAKNPDGAPAKSAHDAAATALGLTEEDRQQMLASGTQLVYKNRAGWAHDRLKRAGLSSSPKRGFWRLTAEGAAFVKVHSAPLSEEETQKLAMDFIGVRLKVPGVAGEQVLPTSAPSEAPAVASPDDQLEVALAELRKSAASDLLEILATVSPSFFERVVLDLLHGMGYGANREDLQQVGGPGDAGIDGVISLDRLGLEKVYVQAKRWQENISRPHLQAFYGALAGQKARKGVFITTSLFSAQARDYAKSVEGIVLVDGPRLAGLMIDHGIGISARVVRIPKIDSDYFDENAA
ncbi:restriction endonuclease [Hydrogenophaga sp.]|uniref:restriction endonuclease n=1 Tax=Hydrogenophaga sp. TaxID=1904254 RepID=UPI00271F275A|nr:restriction endonuclease [Hydrogenophaga sp.]MDO8904420.1 restriction endonuclease [Hydrogenophaga sp.]